MIKQLPDGRWLVDIEPVKGIRYRKRFSTKAEARRFEAVRRSQHAQGDWKEKPKDKRRLVELMQRWYDLHGHTLSDGDRRLAILKIHAIEIGNPVARKLNAQQYLLARGKLLKAGKSGKTLNNRLGYIKAVFNTLIQLHDVQFPNPLVGVKPLKLQERPVSYLTKEQVKGFLEHIKATSDNPHLFPIVKICLSTGARWSEAVNLERGHIRNGTVQFVNTKSKRVRTVPISKVLEQELNTHLDHHGRFINCMLSFRKALSSSGIKLPKGQATHVLRHTFASHFVMNGGNILVLQKILGHSTLNMTMRYAHLAPDHLREATELNPLSTLS
ncbi:phage integrase family protein [Alcanivorax balearicus MACL04]|uniref:Phage integrase family protein n=1 Tax=Alloalcanivorax balearicus MACL04 TaxID=1177182 RepID=A0ABT2R4X2_9GAMM|nr:tyrosine-type recombinase/integrase [Alloalcanivorax balearicus]MCU5784832.1 phage integrase family protein [Alloalcanivorax balearicus MACL04]